MLRFDSYSATQDFVRNAALDRDRHLVQLLTTMTERIVKLEEQLDKLNDLTAGGLLDPFDDRLRSRCAVRTCGGLLSWYTFQKMAVTS